MFLCVYIKPCIRYTVINNNHYLLNTLVININYSNKPNLNTRIHRIVELNIGQIFNIDLYAYKRIISATESFSGKLATAKGLKTPSNICMRYTPSIYKFNLLSVKYKRNI